MLKLTSRTFGTFAREWAAAAVSALAALAVTDATAVNAQSQPPVRPGSSRAIDASRPALLNRAASAPDFGETSAAPDLPPVIPGDDPSQLPQEPDDPETQLAAGQRGMRRDGDLSDPEPPQLRDGIVDIGEPQAPVDGIDPTEVDTRSQEEARLFENPSDPDDPLLFQVEELVPILDRRPQRLFRFEPFDPVGVKAGTFVLFPEIETSGAYFSNTFRSIRARSDVALDVRPSARLVSNWARHALEFRANGLLTYFNEFPSEDDRAYGIEARGRLDITRRTSLQAGLSRDLSQESRSAPDGRSGGPRSDVTTDRAIASLNHPFNRLSLQLRGSVTDIGYGAVTDNGITIDNSTRNYRTTEEAIRATWEFKPTLSAFGEVAANQRDYERRDLTGLDRSSDGERYRVGLSFAGGRTFASTDRPTVPMFAGELSLGYGIQRPASATLPEVSGVILDSTVTWRTSAITSVAFNARSDFGETQSAGVGGIRSQGLGVDVRHELSRYLIGTAGINATFSDYVGSTLEETETRLAAGLEYFLSRDAIVFGRYQHTIFDSNSPNSSYTSDEVRIGMRLRR